MTDQPSPESAQPAAAPAGVAQPKSRTGLWVGLGVAAILVVGAAIAIPISIGNAQAAEEREQERAELAAENARLAIFRRAVEECGFAGFDGVEILDGGEAITLSRVAKVNGPAFGDLSCFLDEIGAPQSIESKIGATRALDGVQSDDWGGFEIEWRYHPDDGATVTVEHVD